MRHIDSYRDWILLSKVPSLGPKRSRELVRYFGSPGKVLSAPVKRLMEVPGIGKEVALSIAGARESMDVEKDLEYMDEAGITLVSFQDSLYPVNLRAISNPPFLLYVRGELRKEDESAVAIVGTRRATTYGKLTARRLARDLGRRGVTIVSGMARGIDTAAHQGALEVGARTIAVLGCGIDVVYPPENRELMEEIVKNGAVISEFPLGTLPEAPNFPQRNRIISGLSKGVVVVEAPLRSGALITVDFALEQGREVFAVPGQVNSPTSQGVNRLIKEGAKLVESVEDVMEELRFSFYKDQAPMKEAEERGRSLSSEEKKIFSLLKDVPVHIDFIISGSGMSASKVAAVLVDLQLKGLIRELPGKLFVKG